MRKRPWASVMALPSGSSWIQLTSKARTRTPRIGFLVSQWITRPQITQMPRSCRIRHQMRCEITCWNLAATPRSLSRHSGWNVVIASCIGSPAPFFEKKRSTSSGDSPS